MGTYKGLDISFDATGDNAEFTLENEDWITVLMMIEESSEQMTDIKKIYGRNALMETKAVNKKTWIIIGVVVALLAVLGVVGFALSRGSAGREESMLELGQRYLDELNYEQAVACFTAYLEIDPKSVEAYAGLAEAYIGLEEYESALNVLAEGYAVLGDESLQELISKYEEQYAEEFDPGVVDEDDDSVTVEEEPPEEEPHEEYNFEAHVIPNGLDVDAEYLTVSVRDNRSATITISGLVLQNSYLTNLSTSKKNACEYAWVIEMHGDQEDFEVSTMSWAFDPGAETINGLEEMTHYVSIHDGDHWLGNTNAVTEMSYTSESITWTFTVPEEYTFDFAKVDRYEVKVYGALQNSLHRTYLLTE